jgi:hypothetical protein
VVIFVTVGVGSSWLSTSAMLAIVVAPTLVMAMATKGWWPAPRRPRAASHAVRVDSSPSRAES